MKDIEIKQILGIPNSTLYDWKKRDDYRKKILDFLEKIDKTEALNILKRKKNILLS